MQGRRQEMRTVWAIALGAAAFRLLLFRGLDLYADEAYYWMWSRRPALGYFDHPPMVAWMIRASTAVLPGELGVRILFLACGALAVVFAALVARELSDDPRAPAVAAALAATSPILMLTGGLALPDAPVEAAYAGATWLVARARGRGWIWAGVAVGLALLSKYTAALLAPALLLLVLVDRDLRHELRTPWPWLGGAVAVLLFLPNLLWNASHDWVAIQFQVRHGLGSQATLRSALEFAGGLLGGAGAVALPLGIWQLARGRGSFSARVAAATLVPIAVTALSAFRGPVEANWAAIAYPALCGAGAAALVRLRPAWSQALLAFTVGLGLLAAVGFGLEVRNPRLVPPDSEAVKRFRGWPEFATRARAAAERGCASIGAASGTGDASGCNPSNPFVFPASYQEAAELAFYAGWTRFGPASERPSQLDLWGDHPLPGEPFLTLGEIPPEKRLFRAEGPGPRTSFEVRLQGEILHQADVEPFRAWEGALPRRVTDLQYLKDAFPR
jgi:4-amino-4-deoxy-L-arabinose transferase-like glycosyltransferase